MMRQGGVQQPGGLGMTHGPTVTDELRAAEQRALQTAQQAMVEAQQWMVEAREQIEILRADAEALWSALYTVAQYVRGQEEDDPSEDGLPEQVSEALRVLAGKPYAPTVPTGACPECVQGKHGNCTQEVIVEEVDGDEIRMVPCPCLTTGHAS